MKKKLSYLIIFTLLLFIGISNVKAVKVTISSNDKVALKKQIEVTFTVSEYKDVPGTMNISYPNDLLRCDSDCPSTKKIEGNTTFTYKFVGIKDGNATIKATTNYSGKDADAQKIIIVGNGSPTTTTTTTQATTTTAQSQKSNNTNIKTLTVKTPDDKLVNLTPLFSSSVYEYQAEVDSSVKMVTINASMEDNKATLIISNNAQQELVAGETNKITLTVTAEDGTKRVYTLNIKRGALTSDATLKSLTIKEDKTFKLKENKYSYVVRIKEDVTKLTIDYELNDTNSKVEVEGNKKLKDGSKVKVLVTAQDGTKKEYTLLIRKEKVTTKAKVDNVSADKNPLIIMGLSIMAFSLIGGIIYVVKK